MFSLKVGDPMTLGLLSTCVDDMVVIDLEYSKQQEKAIESLQTILQTRFKIEKSKIKALWCEKRSDFMSEKRKLLKKIGIDVGTVSLVSPFKEVMPAEKMRAGTSEFDALSSRAFSTAYNSPNTRYQNICNFYPQLNPKMLYLVDNWQYLPPLSTTLG